MEINNDTLNLLVDSIGGDSTKELVELYFETTPTTLNNLYLAFKENDVTNITFWGHKLKGSSATLGFEDMQTTGKEIEELGKQEKIDEAYEQYKTLANQLTSLKQALKGNYPELAKNI